MADTATLEQQAERQAAAIDKVSYEDLYERWEKSNWRATEIDFSEDRTGWHETFSDLERRAALWNYAMFFHGEDSVTDNLSPYIEAAPREEQKYFLATQQVDEARHAVFFGRFMREVVETGDDIASSLTATYPELTWGFRKTFEHLDKVADGLRTDRSRPNLAAAITMYHLVVEATLAQPGQHFIESYLEERHVLPGFRSGMENVSRDEQRHIGFGVKMLSDLVKEDPDCKYAVADLLREVTTMSVGVFAPPNWDRRYVECFGSTIEDVYEQGMISLESKLRAAGLPLEELPGPPPFPVDLEPRERAERAVALLHAGILGEKIGPPSREPEVLEMYFDTVRRSVDTDASPDGPITIQWDFKDAEPWHLRIANGATSAERGRVEDPDVSLRCRFEDWVDITAGREDPRLAIAKGKLRPKGLRTLWRMRKVFPGR
jgi:ribonucleotide reductase beta subunit family protein with ferritin-like domain